LEVLRAMVSSLYDFGRVAVFTPVAPHGMVELASRFTTIDPQVLESLEFGPAILEPELRRYFWEVAVHYFQSEMRVTSIDDFMTFYAATAYYDAGSAPNLREHAAREIAEKGAVSYPKNGYLAIGRGKR